jgi:uncharacterized protein (TIGR02145 family)
MKNLTLLRVAAAWLLVLLLSSNLFSQTFSVSLKAFLEGPFNGSEMNAALNTFNFLPHAQPYNIPPWNYPGTESVAAIPNANVVDWILVELRETAGDASTAYDGDSIAAQAGFILKNGNIVGTDGVNPLQFSCTVTYKLYAVVYHRNHLPVLSGNELVNTAGNYTYDFAVGANQAYGGANAHKEISPGIWGMVSGDGDANGQVNNADKNDIWRPQSGSSGYKAGDFNMNGQVDNVDKNDLWKVNSGKSSQLPGPWICGKPFADARDGQLYSSVQIGTQCWMAENLNVGTMILVSDFPSDNGIIEKYCYGDDPINCDIYGGLYYWREMMQYVTPPGTKGICPLNWHLPTNAEYCILTQFIDPTVDCNPGFSGTDVGIKMKSTSGWYGGGNGTNASGFTALPGGENYYGGNYSSLTYSAAFWTSSEKNGSAAWYWILNYSRSDILNTDGDKDNGFSVRCLKDPPNQPPDPPTNPNPPNNSTNQPLNIQLFWTCTDPDNDPLTYDVYFGTASPPSQVSTGQSSTTYNPGSLSCSITYYWRIVANDDHGHSTEGSVWDFTTQAQPTWQCGDAFIDPRDNQTYTTVQIGTQCWMAENLNIGTMIPGSSFQTNNGTIEKYCYGNQTATCDVYGGLYQGGEMMQYGLGLGVKGICPDGWHLPTDAEYCTLTQFIDPTVNCGVTGYSGTDVGTKMKSTTGWYGGGNGTNASGFNGLPGGYLNPNWGSFDQLTYNGFFWCSSGTYTNPSWIRRLYWDKGSINRDDYPESYGFSVRCVKNVLPEVSTDNITNITGTTATGGGKVINEGMNPVTSRGVCWSISLNPTLNDPHTVDGSGPGVFVSQITGLNPLTTYYVRAYATNQVGTSYGNQVNFTTLDPYPVVTTASITNITVSTATGGGNVTDEGMYPVTERGVCWNTNQNPTLNDPHTIDGSGPGMFVSQLTGLNPGTYYYVRAYATNQAGTAYGNQVNFFTLLTPQNPCPGVPTITYGGQVYNTALIGTQCWLRENLNIGTMINSGTSQTNNGIIEKYCYENNQANCTLYGGLYQWNEMMQYVTTPGVKGICPNGWHLPTDEELKVLEGYADSQYNYPDPVWDQTGWRGFDAGKNLKSTSGWDSNGNGADLYGFTALPGGYWGYFGVFINLGSMGTFWTSTENNSTTAWWRIIDSYDDKIYRTNSYNKGNGHSVRCLKD